MGTVDIEPSLSPMRRFNILVESTDSDTAIERFLSRLMQEEIGTGTDADGK